MRQNAKNKKKTQKILIHKLLFASCRAQVCCTHKYSQNCFLNQTAQKQISVKKYEKTENACHIFCVFVFEPLTTDLN